MDERFGKLQVVGPGKSNNHWRCRCDCGTEVDVYPKHLRTGRYASCGCDGTSLGIRLSGMTKKQKQPLAKAHGVCTQCFIRRPLDGKTRCQECTDRWHRIRKDRLIKAASQGVKLCSECTKNKALPGRGVCEKCAKIRKDQKHRYGERVKDQVFKAYGDRCECCGETERRFLTIDHTNNDGAKHRRENKSASSKLYSWIKSHGYPKTFRLLCYNCNLGRDKCEDKICPHKKACISDLVVGAGI